MVTVPALMSPTSAERRRDHRGCWLPTPQVTPATIGADPQPDCRRILDGELATSGPETAGDHPRSGPSRAAGETRDLRSLPGALPAGARKR